MFTTDLFERSALLVADGGSNEFPEPAFCRRPLNPNDAQLSSRPPDTRRPVCFQPTLGDVEHLHFHRPRSLGTGTYQLAIKDP